MRGFLEQAKEKLQAYRNANSAASNADIVEAIASHRDELLIGGLDWECLFGRAYPLTSGDLSITTYFELIRAFLALAISVSFALSTCG